MPLTIGLELENYFYQGITSKKESILSIIDEQTSYDFLQEVTERLEEIEQHSHLIRDGEVLPQVLVYATATYYANAVWLLKLYENETLQEEGIQQDFKIVWSEWIIEASKKLNTERIKSKYASQTEIEAQAIVDNKEEWQEWQKKLLLSKRRVSLYRRIKDDWASVLQILIQLNANSRSEMKSLHAERFSENETNKVSEERRVKKIKTMRGEEA